MTNLLRPRGAFFIGRILTIFLIVNFLLPNPAGVYPELSRRALRPMTGEGAGLEEMNARLRERFPKSVPSVSSGFEEIPIESVWRVFPELLGDAATVAFSRDGKTVFAGGQDTRVFKWDLATGRFLGKDWFHSGGLKDLVISPSGRFSAAVDENVVRVWNTETGKLVWATSLTKERGKYGLFYLAGLSFTSNGELILPMTDGNAIRLKRIFQEDPSIEDWPELVWLNQPIKNVRLSFSVSAERVVSSGTGSKISVWDARSGNLLGRWDTGLSRIAAVAVGSSGNKISAVDSEGMAAILNGETGDIERKFQAVSSRVHGMVFSPSEDRLVLLSSDGGIQIQNLVHPGALYSVLEGHGGSVQDAVFSPDGALLLSAGRDGTVRLWGSSFETLDAILRTVSPDDARWKQAVEWLGIQGGRPAVERLLELTPGASSETFSRGVVLSLVAASNAPGPIAFSSAQWNEWLAMLRGSLRYQSDPFEHGSVDLLERSFWRVLGFPGPALEPSVFENSLRETLSAIQKSDYWVREAGPSNPKDRLAHALMVLKLKHYMSGYDREAVVLAEGLWRSGISYQELIKISDLLDRYPGPVSNSLIQIAQASDGQPAYLKTAIHWWVDMDGMAPAFEILGIRDELAQPISQGGAVPGIDFFAESAASAKQRIARQAEEVLGIRFDPALPIPFLDERFPEPQRARFIRSLLYQAEQNGDVSREILAAYFLELQRHPEQPELAIKAVDAVLKQRAADFPSDLFLRGPPARDYSVRASEQASADFSKIDEAFAAARKALADLAADSSGSETSKVAIRTVLDQWPDRVRGLSGSIELQKSVQTATQFFLESLLNGDRLRLLPRIQSIRSQMHQGVSQLSAKESLLRARFVRMGVERDPTKKLHFAWPSDSCLDCQNGTHRKFTQHYLGPNEILIVAEDPEQREVPFLARLTLTRTAEGGLLVSNPFIQQQQSLDLLPFFIEFLEEYAQLLNVPVWIPQKFMNQPKGWRSSQQTVTLPVSIGRDFHADVAVSAAVVLETLPIRLKHLAVWSYVPSPAPAQKPDHAGISIRDMNRLVEMMGRFLAANSEAEVDTSFVRGIQDALGFDGVALYRVRSADNATGYEINSGVRTLEEPSRFSSWAAPTAEHREALMSGKDDFFILDRSDQAEVSFVDLERLRQDRERYPGGNVNSVYYVVLRNFEGQPWGLVLAHRWKSGNPIFGEGPDDEKAYRRKQTREMVQILGNGALLAYQQAQAHQLLRNYLELSKIGGPLAGNLEKMLVRLRVLSGSSGILAQPGRIEELSTLAGEMKSLVDQLQVHAVQVRDISRHRRIEPPSKAATLPIMIESVEGMETLLGDFSLSLLSAVSVQQDGEIDRVTAEFFSGETGLNSVVDAVLRGWVDLARQTLEARRQMENENSQFLPHLREFVEGFKRLNQVRARLLQIAATNHLPDDLAPALRTVVDEFDGMSSHLDTAIQQINESLEQAGQPVIVVTAGMEESSGRVLSYRHLVTHQSSKLPSTQLHLGKNSSLPLFLPSSRPLFIPSALMTDTAVRLVHQDEMNPAIYSADQWLELHILPSRDRDIRLRILRHSDEDRFGSEVVSTHWITDGEPVFSNKRFQIRKTRNGVIVTPKRNKVFYAEWFPDEIRLTVNQWARFGSVIEKIRDDGGEEITRSLARLPATDTTEYWHGDGRDEKIRIIRTGLMPLPDGDGIGPQLIVHIPSGRWNAKQLENLIGFSLEKGSSTRDLPIRSSDGPRLLKVGIQNDANGLLRILTPPEPVIGLPNNLRILVRLLAYLTEPAESPRYNSTVSTSKLKEIIHKHDQKGKTFDANLYPLRYEATWALARRPEATDFLLERLRAGGPEWEKAPTIRRMIIAEWIYGLEKNGDLFSLDQKARIWTALAGLLTGSRFDNSLPFYEQDSSEQVQWAALQGLVRFIPPADIPAELNTYQLQTVDALQFASHHSSFELVRDEADQFWMALKSGKPIRIKFWQGASVEDLPGRQGGLSSGGLEEGKIVLPQDAAAVMPRFFYHPALRPLNFSGIEEVALPSDPEAARVFLKEIGAHLGDVVFLPDSIAAGAEEDWRIDGISVVVLPVVLFDELTPNHLAALAILAALRPDQLLRVGLEEWTQSVVDGVEYLQVQS